MVRRLGGAVRFILSVLQGVVLAHVVSLADPVHGWQAVLGPLLLPYFTEKYRELSLTESWPVKRAWTIDEWSLLKRAWGPINPHHFPREIHVDAGRARVEFDTCDPEGTLKLFLPADADDASKIHEVGHCIHLALWPESAKWSEAKCEVFAMLGVVKAGLDADYGDIEAAKAARRLLAQAGGDITYAMSLAAL